MSTPVIKPILFFDFDNTVTQGDVLDAVLERYSETDAWREWETDWQEGRISTRECLLRQVGNLRVSSDELLRYVAGVRIDPDFARIVDWAARNAVELTIVSDNFSSLVRKILFYAGLHAVPVYANELTFSGDRPEAHFPFTDVACPRCAHCKAQHLRPRGERTRIFVGDGLSDVCPALVADVVFAKDSLAAELARRGLPFRPFRSLADVYQHLQVNYGSQMDRFASSPSS
jgi:2,3-diketo-5-methylthio-1-phosphopentane phosphatase